MSSFGLSGVVKRRGSATGGYVRHAHSRWDGGRRHGRAGDGWPMSAIINDHIVDIAPDIVGTATRVIDATDRVVTPGFVDIHTHLDAQLAWDPIGSSSCYHGITSVVMGNCGVTFAPCKPEDREVLAAMMESVEDIPRDAILDGLAWDWVTYGEYLDSVGRMPKGLNVGGMVGHCALRQYAMGERGLEQAPPTADDLAIDDRPARRGDARGSAGLQHQPHVPAQGARRPPGAGHVRRARGALRVRRRAAAVTAPACSRAPAASARAIATTPTSRAPAPRWRGWARSAGAAAARSASACCSTTVAPICMRRSSSSPSTRTRTRRQRPATDHGAQRRHPVQPRHPQSVRSGVVLARAATSMHNGKKLVALRDPATRARLIEGADATPPSARPRATVRRQPARRFDASRRAVRPRSVDLARRDRRPARHQRRGCVHRAAARERRRPGVQLPVPQPDAVGRRAHARRAARHARPGRRRCPRRSDPRCQPADLPAVVLDPRAAAVEPRGGRSPAHQRHRRSVRIGRPRPADDG